MNLSPTSLQSLASMMFRLITAFAKTTWQLPGLVALILFFIVSYFALAGPARYFFPVVLFALWVAVPVIRRRKEAAYIWRFARATWRFGRSNHGSIILRHDQRLAPTRVLEEIHAACLDSMRDLAKHFGFELKKPILVYVFQEKFDLQAIMRSPHAAFSIPDAAVICVGGELTEPDRLQVIRHEITHVFADQLSPFAPRYLCEGLATWLMGPMRGKSVHYYALSRLRDGRYLHLSWLADGWISYLHPGAIYAMSGSFVGWLIERFGWEAVRDFYASHTAPRRWPSFQKAFGLGLLAAEREWREHLLKEQMNWKIDLGKDLPFIRLRAAIQAGHLFRALDECSSLFGTEHDSRSVHECAGYAHARLGNYETAVAELETALRLPADPDHDDEEGHSSALLLLGHLHDLMNRPHDAGKYYKQVLNLPNVWMDDKGSSHEAARRALGKPFAEEDFAQHYLRRAFYPVMADHLPIRLLH